MILKRRLDLSILSNRLPLTIVLMVILFVPGCADMRGYLARSLPLAGYPADAIERNDFVVATGDDVIGRLATVRLQGGDTLPDIARHFSLGINTIRAANPGVDIWVPEAGETVLLPMRYGAKHLERITS